MKWLHEEKTKQNKLTKKTSSRTAPERATLCPSSGFQITQSTEYRWLRSVGCRRLSNYRYLWSIGLLFSQHRPCRRPCRIATLYGTAQPAADHFRFLHAVARQCRRSRPARVIHQGCTLASWEPLGCITTAARVFGTECEGSYYFPTGIPPAKVRAGIYFYFRETLRLFYVLNFAFHLKETRVGLFFVFF